MEVLERKQQNLSKWKEILMPYFSIIIPIFNSEKWLSRCIESVLNQTYSSFEVILIDDGSFDISLKICNYWKNQDERIRVFHQNNRGASAARNFGIKKAKGKYIQFVDSDDTLPSNCLEQIQKELDSCKEPDIVEFRLTYIGPDGTTNIQGTPLVSGLYNRKYIEESFLPVMLQTVENNEAYYPVFNVLRIIKRKLVIENSIYFCESIRRWEDWLFAMEVYIKANEMLVVPKPLYNYYGHIGGGLGGKYDRATYEYVVTAYKRIEKLVGDKYAMYSKYAVKNRVELIERCIREVYHYENPQRRKRITLDILQNTYFKELLMTGDSNQSIMFLRRMIINNKYELAYLMLTLYIAITNLKKLIGSKTRSVIKRIGIRK